MGDLSPHFSRSEFSCPCGCKFDRPDPALVKGLEMLRLAVQAPVVIVSGCRCRKHNDEVGGAKASWHLDGKAADIAIDGRSARSLYDIARQVAMFGGFGVNSNAETLHVDVRPVTARWCYDAAGHQASWMENA